LRISQGKINATASLLSLSLSLSLFAIIIDRFLYDKIHSDSEESKLEKILSELNNSHSRSLSLSLPLSSFDFTSWMTGRPKDPNPVIAISSKNAEWN
jgi:hypothetical protein